MPRCAARLWYQFEPAPPRGHSMKRGVSRPLEHAMPVPFLSPALRAAGIQLLLLTALSAGWATTARAQTQDLAFGNCGNPFQNHFGPFDFRSAPRPDVEIVEKYHFTPGIESLTKPVNTTFDAMAGDVAYTLHVFPNHHRALIAMMRLGERHKKDTPPGASRSVDCYFRRAVTFRPDDTVVRGIYAIYLNKHGRRPEALQHLEQAKQSAADNPISNYTIGNVYLELGEFELALAQARKAKELGNPRGELEAALRAAGKWQDPPSGN